MIERRRRPCGARVARSAILWEVAGDMVWIRRTREVRAVTLVAVCVHELVITAYMARSARQR